MQTITEHSNHTIGSILELIIHNHSENILLTEIIKKKDDNLYLSSLGT